MPQCNVKFCKIVAGLPGDELIIDQEYLSINGTRITTLPSQTKLEYTTSGIIPEGHFFALGTAENSFDSRYSTFGLVPFTSIESVLWPLF